MNFHFGVTVTAATESQAEQVMAERLGYDEDYGFSYELGWAPAKAVRATRCPHCGNKVRLELDINFLVCRGCCEILYVNELVSSERVGA